MDSGKPLIVVAAILLAAIFVRGDVLNFRIEGGVFRDELGTPIVQEDTLDQSILFQLVNLGANGVFDPVVPGSFVSGDDLLIDLNEGPTFGSAFSIGGFSKFPGLEGYLQRTFAIEETVGIAEAGDVVGLRWFPEYTLADYAAGALPLGGEVYGEVSVTEVRSFPSEPDRTAWVLPSTSVTSVSFDPAVSPDGSSLNSDWVATPGFSGLPDLEVAAFLWSGWTLLDSEDVLLGSGETLRRSLYQVPETGAYRLVKQWFPQGGVGGFPESYAVAVAGEWLVNGWENAERSGVITALEDAGLTVNEPSEVDWLLVAGLDDPETISLADLDGLTTSLNGDLRASFGPELFVLPNPVGTAEDVPVWFAREPDDSRYDEQSALAALEAPQAWYDCQGSTEVVVGIIDTGMQTSHPDLAANLWTNPAEIPFNGQDDDGNGLIDDRNGWDFVEADNDPQDTDGHGTQMAGIIGAVGDNGTGIAGVNWRVRLLPLRCGATNLTDAHVVSAIDYAITLKQSGVPLVALNLSYRKSSNDSPSVDTALRLAVERATVAGILLIASAGNDGRDNDLNDGRTQPYVYPADYPEVIAVASHDDTGALLANSNFGATRVDLAAPGESILSTAHNGGYARASGTSQAAAFVTGAVALAAACAPDAGFDRLRQIILRAAQSDSQLTDKVSTGGRLSLAHLMQAVWLDQWSVGEFGPDYLSLLNTNFDEDFEGDRQANFVEMARLSPAAADGPSGQGRMSFNVDVRAWDVAFEQNPHTRWVPAGLESTDNLTSNPDWTSHPNDQISFEGINASSGMLQFSAKVPFEDSATVDFLRQVYDRPFVQ